MLYVYTTTKDLIIYGPVWKLEKNIYTYLHNVYTNDRLGEYILL